jgi:hypothetical protein
MPCTSAGCDIHDYRVAPVWCAYQSALVSEARHIRALEALADRGSFGFGEEPPPPRPIKVTPPPLAARDDRKARASRERGIQWQL